MTMAAPTQPFQKQTHDRLTIKETPIAQILHSSGPLFISKVQAKVTKLGIDTSKFQIDHICYRTSTQEEYVARKRELEDVGELLIESIVGGRMIATYRLKTPIVCLDGSTINVVELPSPKVGSEYVSGLEHCEFVITGALEEFV